MKPVLVETQQGRPNYIIYIYIHIYICVCVIYIYIYTQYNIFIYIYINAIYHNIYLYVINIYTHNIIYIYAHMRYITILYICDIYIYICVCACVYAQLYTRFQFKWWLCLIVFGLGWLISRLSPMTFWLFRWPTAALWWHTRKLRPGDFCWRL